MAALAANDADKPLGPVHASRAGSVDIHRGQEARVLPRIGGKALADQLLSRCPDVKVLFMSGYTDSAIVHRGQLDPDVAFIQKPFTPAQLARKVRETLDAPAAPQRGEQDVR